VPEPIAKVEYDRLIAYFDKLVKYTLLAITFILGMAGAFLWKNTDDVKTQAAAAIKTTQDGATQAISDIGKSAQATAKVQAQAAIDSAFERQNVQRMVESTAQKKVDAAVDEAVRRNLESRIEAFRALTAKIGEVSSHGAQLRAEFRDGLDGLLKDSKDPDRAFAHSTLLAIAADYEAAMKNNNFSLLPAGLPPKSLMGTIRLDSSGPRAAMRVAEAFVQMQKKVQWDVQTFDIPAAEKWCTQHKPKCEE
jgi:hypothetical protein